MDGVRQDAVQAFLATPFNNPGKKVWDYQNFFLHRNKLLSLKKIGIVIQIFFEFISKLNLAKCSQNFQMTFNFNKMNRFLRTFFQLRNQFSKVFRKKVSWAARFFNNFLWTKEDKFFIRSISTGNHKFALNIVPSEIFWIFSWI